MDGLLGYGSSDSEDDASDGPQSSIQESSKLNSHIDPVTPAPQSFPPIVEQETKLDISDDEEVYIPKSKQPKLNSHDAVSAPPPAAMLPQLQNITKIIDKAQVVSVPTDSLQSEGGLISNLLPAPKANSVQELELEHLRKGKRSKKDKRKIFALDLDDFKEEDESDKPKVKRPESSKTKCGLFSILPDPKNCNISTKSTKSVVKPRSVKTSQIFQPRTLKKPKSAVEPEPEIEEENGSDFFSFSSSDKVSKDIEKAAKAVKLDPYKPKKVLTTPETMQVHGELRSIDAIITPSEPAAEPPSLDDVQNNVEELPPGFRDLPFNSTDIIDVNQVIPSTEEWAVKNLDYSDEKPQSSTKCPVGGQTKRKNQINYLAWQAKERESELKNQWANNKMNRYATQNRYGFR